MLRRPNMMALSITPRYRVVAAEGPDHAKTFTVEVWLGELIVATGSGSSKQVAEQIAARTALHDIEARNRGGGNDPEEVQGP